MLLLPSHKVHSFAQVAIGSVWVFHGVYSKLLNGIPRHRLIVGKILGAKRAQNATRIVGILEFLLGVWVFTGWQTVWMRSNSERRRSFTMNSIEILLARELLISAIGMLILNIGFLSLVWWWALFTQVN